MDYTLTTAVFATFSVVGFHRWPDAPDEVSYLSSEHRHKFGIKVEVGVLEHDREVEFHILRRVVEAHMPYVARGLSASGALGLSDGVEDGYVEYLFGAMSCEMIATSILAYLQTCYPGRSLYRVTVDEDGENGATVETRVQA